MTVTNEELNSFKVGDKVFVKLSTAHVWATPEEGNKADRKYHTDGFFGEILMASEGNNNVGNPFIGVGIIGNGAYIHIANASSLNPDLIWSADEVRLATEKEIASIEAVEGE